MADIVKVNEMVTVLIDCGICKKTKKVEVKKSDYAKWKAGTFAQKAFPYLTDGERELLISNTCESCFDTLFAEPDEEE